MAGVDWKIYPECVSSAYVCVGKGTRLPVDAESTFVSNMYRRWMSQCALNWGKQKLWNIV